MSRSYGAVLVLIEELEDGTKLRAELDVTIWPATFYEDSELVEHGHRYYVNGDEVQLADVPQYADTFNDLFERIIQDGKEESV